MAKQRQKTDAAPRKDPLRDSLREVVPSVEERLQSIEALARALHMAAHDCDGMAGRQITSALRGIVWEITAHAKAAQLALYDARDAANLRAPTSYQQEASNG